MLLSLGLLLLMGLVLAALFKKIQLPTLIGFIITGIVLGPHVLNQMDSNLLLISSDLRTLALVIILIRAGLSLDIHKIIKQGRIAILLTFLPATFEIVGSVLFAHFMLGWTWLDGFILGTILAAVSPAVIVPRMLHLIERKYGSKHGIPDMVMAGASADDIYVILLFTIGISIYQTGTFQVVDVVFLPLKVILGVVYGLLLGKLLVIFFKKVHIRDTIKVLIIIGLSLVLISLENALYYSGLLSIVSLALMIYQDYPILSSRLLKKYEKIWLFAEMLLFVLVGAALDISVIPTIGFIGLGLIVSVLIIRLLGVWVCTIQSNTTKKEKLFMVISYIPKATVQASIGAIPLALGMAKGTEILAIAVMAILITAPIGALLIDQTQYRLLAIENT
ncbi:cation:proton antiporter [Paracholeplasma manati]|uniref:Cation:proton antiporter n=1 Tax=Paracholeplasma manati TaxID=591373 RepID=A0ABT2Y6G5_9MOLU|nr:cation:proton antiporter [Paracholeplasma manati]MCV2232332.1 cation:proton antiporter [Paracholeplasma manati]MDG0888289.1 cation:proton antiporter [Paracholeplasma manati]